MRSALRRTALFGALAVAFLGGTIAEVAVLPASALATAPIALDAPDNGSQPLIAYDPTTQTTYVAWSDPHMETSPGVDLCILPAGATACLGGAPVLLEDSKYPGYAADNTPGLGGLVVLPGGETVVIGTPVSTGSIAWASPPGGAAFLSAENGLQNGGQFISPVSLFNALGNAVALNSTDVGLLDDYDNFFSDSPLTAESPAISSPNSNPGEQYPRKAFATNGPEIAAVPAPAPAPVGSDIVVGVGSNNSSAQLTPAGCLNDAASGYGVSAGTVDGTSKAADTLNNEGLPAYKLLACSAESPVLAQGGADGIGVLEQEGTGVDGAGSDFTLDYHPFDATATGGSFGAPVELADVTSQVLDGVNELDLADDAGTGVYALWEDGQGTVIDYSSDGGAIWGGPTVAPPPYGGNDVIAGIGGGNAEIAYDSNPGTGQQVFLQFVNYQALVAANSPAPPPPPPPPPPALASLTIPKQTDNVTGKGNLSVVVDCAGAKCSGSFTLLAKVKKTTGKGKKKKTKTVMETIGTVSFTSLAIGTDPVAIKLGSKGLSLLKHDGYKLHSTGSATYLSGAVFKTATGAVALKGHKPKKKKK